MKIKVNELKLNGNKIKKREDHFLEMTLLLNIRIQSI